MKSFLPAHATIEESCAWLTEQTSEQWGLARLLECGLTPWFWLDYSPGLPDIFGDRREGYLAPMLFASDTHRLSATRGDVLVTMSRTYDGKIFKIDSPQWHIPVSELRFLRDDVKRLAADIVATEKADKPQPAPENDTPTQQLASTGILKNQAIIAFGGLVKIDLAGAMEEGKIWLQDARVSRGARGRYQSKWNPVLLAIALHEHKRVSKARLNQAFFANEFLLPWLEEWKEHSEGLSH